VAKKREIFLIQMNLDTKRAEICNLGQKALERKNAIKKSEDMLEDDASSSMPFLRRTTKKYSKPYAARNPRLRRNKTRQAMSSSDWIYKQGYSPGQISEIKKIQNEILAVKSEVNKCEELLEDYQLYSY